MVEHPRVLRYFLRVVNNQWGKHITLLAATDVKQVKSTLECLDYLKQIHNRFFATGLEPSLEIANFKDKLRSLPKHESYLTDFFK